MGVLWCDSNGHGTELDLVVIKKSHLWRVKDCKAVVGVDCSDSTSHCGSALFQFQRAAMVELHSDSKGLQW